MLEIKNLHVNVDGREILKGLDLELPKGQVHAIMGPNGSGKSTLAYVLAGKEDYEVTAGSVTWNGQDLLAMDPSERAAAGVFLAFQYPMEIPGVATMTFLRTAANAVRKARGETELSTPDFLRFVREKAAELKIDPEMLRRPLNVGFSGGEKKRNEILQMSLLEPSLCVLDETDSGLDIDAVRIVAEGVNALRGPERAMLVITHYQRLLDYIVPDRVHVLSDGRVARSGGPELALELEQSGYAEFGDAAARLRKGTAWSFRSSSSRRAPSRPFSTCSPRPSRGSLAPATLGSPICAPRRSTPMPRSGCRIAASRPGNIPTCAPGSPRLCRSRVRPASPSPRLSSRGRSAPRSRASRPIGWSSSKASSGPSCPTSRD